MRTVVATRISTEEVRKLDRLARCAGLNRSYALRALLRAADYIEPPKLAIAHLEDSGGAGVRQDLARAAA